MHAAAHRSAVRARSVAVWLVVTIATAGVVLATAPRAQDLLGARSTDFADLLTGLCAIAAACAAVALWALTTEVVVGALRGTRIRAGRAGCVRRMVLAACGVAVLAGAPGLPAAGADGGGEAAPLPARALDGLPLPDRADGAPATAPAPGGVVRVAPGDSLWAIARRALGPTATPADVAAYGRRIHAVNRSTIGPDPDLIHPDQQLRLPRP